jgi:hypothetical protein
VGVATRHLSDETDLMDATPLARDVLELQLERPSLRRRLIGWFAVVTSNLAFEGNGVRHPGGTTARVVDRTTNRTICQVAEELGGDGTSEFARLISDYESATLESFLARWSATG